MEWHYTDGGRRAAGYKGVAGDCGTRAAAIATGLPYQQVYSDLKETAKRERPRKGRKRSSVRDGTHKATMRRYLEGELGWEWTPTMFIGQGCQVHMRATELPGGPLVVSLSRHFAAVIDGVLHDNHDCTRDGSRCVYGYWSPPKV